MDSPEVEGDLVSPSASNELSRAQKLLTNVIKIFETSRSESASTLDSPLPNPRRSHHHSSSKPPSKSIFNTSGPLNSSQHYSRSKVMSSLARKLDMDNWIRSESESPSLDSPLPTSRRRRRHHNHPTNNHHHHLPSSTSKLRPSKTIFDSSSGPLSNSQHYSRSKVISSLAKKFDKKQCNKKENWSRTIKKEEDERRAACVERTNILANFASKLQMMKSRLNIFLEGANVSSDSSDIEALSEEVITFKEKTMADKNQCILSLAQSIVHLILGKLQCNQITGQKAQTCFEKIFYLPVSTIKLMIVGASNDDNALYHWFRECQLQILYRMETSWLLLGEKDTFDNIRTDIIDFLKVLSAYCHEPRVQDFMSDVLVLGYLETHSELLIELFRGLHVDPPLHLLANISPNKEKVKSIFGSSPSRSSFGGSSTSPFGSTNSVFRPPSALKKSSKHGIKRFPTQDSFVSNKSSARYTNHVYVNNPKKMILVPVPKSKTVLCKKVGNSKSSNTIGHSKGPSKPKTIRRNLFQVDKSNKSNSSDTKALLSVTSTSIFSRSPSVSSHKSYNRLLSSQSPRNRSLRSKRRLDMDSCDDVRVTAGSNVGSPDLFSPNNDRIICPATPSYKPGNSCKKLRRSLNYGSSGEKKVIMESPEMTKQVYSQSFSQVVQSLSFYSTGSDSFKSRSRAWEKSGNKMLAAKIKRKVDSSSFMNSGLTLSDLEIIGCTSSPDCKSVVSESLNMSSSGMPSIKMGGDDETPCCSKSLNPNRVEVVQANVNANIEALIRNDQTFAISSALMKQTNSATPTKKISFNFDESLIKTPNRMTSPATPKSILKTPNRNTSPKENSATKSDII